MANNLITSSLVSKLFLARFTASNAFLNTGSRGLEGDFTNPYYKPGQSVQIRKRNKFKAVDGQQATPTDINDATETVTINHQYHVMIDLSSVEEGYAIADFTEQFITPAVDAINAKMNSDIYQQALQELNYVYGSASAPLAENTLFGAQAFMRKLQIPSRDRVLVASPDACANLNATLYNTFNTNFNEDIIMEGELGQFAGFRIFEDETITPFVTTSPIPGTPVLASSSNSGDTTINISGLPASTANVLIAGDVISINGVHSITPLTYQSTNQLMTFVVTANASSNSSGAATVSIAPAIIWDPTNSQQNVDLQPLAGAAIAKIGTATNNIAFHPSGLDIVCPPLPKLKTVESDVAYDPRYNVSVRLSAGADIYASQNLYRLDVLCGFKWHQQYALRVLSQ